MMQNVGKFSPKIGVNGVDYSLYPVAIPYGSSNVLVFDTLSRSFYKASATGGSLAVCTDEDVSVNGTTATISYSNYTMIRMFEFGLYDSNVRQGFALMRDSGDTYCLAQIVLGTQNAFRSLNTIEDNAQLLTSTVMAAPKTGNFVYFAIDNKVYCYEIAPGLSLVDKERLLMTLSDNDPITYMAYFNVDNNGNECYLAMLTNPTQGWKLHIYPVVNPGNPTLTNSPTIYTGEGTGRYVMHRKI
jgi:hypothetical protein